MGWPSARAMLLRGDSAGAPCVGLAGRGTQQTQGSMSQGLFSAPLLPKHVKPLQLHLPCSRSDRVDCSRCRDGK